MGGTGTGPLTDADVMRIDGELLERGDIIYERVQVDDHTIKFKPFRVIDALRAAVKVAPMDGRGTATTIHNSRLRMLPPAQVERRKDGKSGPPATLGEVAKAAQSLPSTVPAQEPAKTSTKATATELDAWIRMGLDLSDQLARDSAATKAEIDRCAKALDELNAAHEAAIAQMEAELKRARERHEHERDLVTTRMQQLSYQLAASEARRATIRDVVKGASQ